MLKFTLTLLSFFYYCYTEKPQPDSTDGIELTFNQAPKVKKSISTIHTQVGNIFSYEIPLQDIFYDIDKDDELIYQLVSKGKANLPFWMEFNPTTNELSGNPTNEDAGTYILAAIAYDKEGRQTSTFFELCVKENPLQPAKEKYKSFDDELFWKYIDTNPLRGIYQLEDKDLILLFGYTGAGKSTTLNYLLGHQMIGVRKGIVMAIEVKRQKSGVRLVGIGHEKKANTARPEAYQTKQHAFLYTDTPGLADNRGKEVVLFNTLSINRFVNYARSVKAILCVVPVGDLDSKKGSIFTDLVQELDFILTNLTEYMPNIFWLFTKLDPRIEREALINEIEGIKSAVIANREDLEKKFPDDWIERWDKRKEDQSKIKVLDSILDYQNIFPVKPLDQGKSRNKIESALNKIQTNIPKERFRIPLNNENDDIHSTIINLAKNEEVVKESLLDRLLKLKKSIAKEEEELKELQVALAQKELPEKYIERKIEQKISEKSLLEERITKKKKEIAEITAQGEKFKLYREIRKSPYAYFFGNEIEIRYEDFPFEDRGPTIYYVGGNVTIIDNDPKKGHFLAKYTLPVNWKNMFAASLTTGTIMLTMGGVAGLTSFTTGILGLNPEEGTILVQFEVKRKYIDKVYTDQLKKELREYRINLSTVNEYITKIKKNTKRYLKNRVRKLRIDLLQHQNLLSEYEETLAKKDERMRFIRDAYKLLTSSCSDLKETSKNSSIICSVYDDGLERFSKLYDDYEDTCPDQ